MQEVCPLYQISALYSTLSGADLTRLVAMEYSLPDAQVVLLRRGYNDHYRVTAGDQTFILRVYMHDKYYITGPDDLRFELELLAHLTQEGVPAAPAVARLDGELLGSLTAPEGVRHYALFQPAPGSPVSEPAEPQIRELAATLARFHLAADRYRPRFTRYDLDLRMLVDRPAERLARYLAGQPDDLQFLHDMAARIRSELSALPVPPGGWGIIHGDLHTGNCHFDGDQPTLFDFDTCGFGWRAYDVAVGAGSRDETFHSTFLAAYQSVRPLSEAERNALPTFLRARYLWDGGDALALAPIWGEAPSRRIAANTVREMRALETRLTG